jgi:condensin complex subunit 3
MILLRAFSVPFHIFLSSELTGLNDGRRSEVRRAALFNLLPTPLTLPALLLRTLDLDPINRRGTYTHVLSDIPCSGLTKEQREIVIVRGLRDRVEGVRRAAAGLVGKWATEAGGVLEFIKLFDIYEGKATELILDAIFEIKPEMIEDIDFGGA